MRVKLVKLNGHGKMSRAKRSRADVSPGDK